MNVTACSETDKDLVRKACEGVGVNTRGALLIVPVSQVKGKKAQHRIIVLTQYRLLSVKNKKKVTKNLHYYDLRLFCGETDVEVLFQFQGKKSKEVTTLVLQSPESPSLVRFVLNAYARITHGFATEKLCQMKLRDKYLKELNEAAIDFGPADGLVETYRAWCSYLGKPVCPEFLNLVQLLHHDQRRDLDLRQFPIMSVKTELNMTLAHGPLISSLIHNTYFREVVCTNTPLSKDDMVLFSKVVRYNRTLEKVVLSGVSQTNDWTLSFAQALADNKHNRIQILDISYNKLGDLGLKNICLPGLMGMVHGLSVLNLAHCNIKPQGIHTLICCFMKHLGLSASLEELDLSYNSFDLESSIAMECWMASIKDFGRLRVLRLAGSHADLPSVLQPLRAFPLQDLDISENKIDEAACKVLCSFLELSHTITALNVTRCSLVGSMGERILVAIAMNNNLKSIGVNMSDNGMGEAEAEGLTSALLINKHLSSINLSNNHFKDVGMIGILQGLVLSQTRTLERLVLDDAIGGMNTLAGDRISSALTSVLSTITSLKSLSVAGGLGKVAIPFLAAGLKCPNLQHLDVSDNKLGDIGAAALAEILRKNNTLLVLEADGNEIGLAGWDLLSSAIQRNQTLQHCGFPWRDYNRAIGGLRPAQRQWLQRILLDMQQALHSNRTLRFEKEAAQYMPDILPSSGPRPSFLRPLAQIPEMAEALSATCVVPGHLHGQEGIYLRPPEVPRFVEEMLQQERRNEEEQKVAELNTVTPLREEAHRQSSALPCPNPEPSGTVEEWEAEQMAMTIDRLVKEMGQEEMHPSEPSLPPPLPPRDDTHVEAHTSERKEKKVRKKASSRNRESGRDHHRSRKHENEN